jgi:hypothetical protein
MIFSFASHEHPRAWLKHIVRAALDDLIADPLSLSRAHGALILAVQLHERAYYYLARESPNALDGASLEDFRRAFAGTVMCFDPLAAVASGKSGDTLKYSNILSPAALLSLGSPSKLRRSIIVHRLNRQLIPLLEELLAANERLLDQFDM